MLTVGDLFPDFNCQACVGTDGATDLVEIDNSADNGKWKLFFFYPKDFTFICPTELVEFGNRQADFAKLNTVIYGGSTDNEHSHLAWRQADSNLNTLPYPLLAAQKLADDLDILDRSENVCLRATFIVDPEGIIQWASANSLDVGRNIDEILRVLSAIQTGELMPCNWKPGEAVLKGYS